LAKAAALANDFLFVKIFKPLSSPFSAPTVGMWATGHRAIHAGSSGVPPSLGSPGIMLLLIRESNGLKNIITS
jgi:hypothetical protein